MGEIDFIKRKCLGFAMLAALCVLLATGGATAQDRFITLASTTSTDNSGLFRHMLPRFTKTSGIAVRVVAVGTGAALRLGRQGDVDLLLVHARSAEMHFIASGHGIDRRDVMHNDFVLIGPIYDPAGIRGRIDITAALKRIAEKKIYFASRGDNSGTHMAERRYWSETGISPRAGSGLWYFETGAGMGATLNFAAARSAYTITDRATWLGFRNRDQLSILVQGDSRMFNPYGVILVNPDRHPNVKHKDAKIFADWLTSAAGRAAISGFRIENQQVFYPSIDRLPDRIRRRAR
ncbi:MAG: substrate-binding domain-containing protein [Alphaproteobacteria bacterium]